MMRILIGVAFVWVTVLTIELHTMRTTISQYDTHMIELLHKQPIHNVNFETHTTSQISLEYPPCACRFIVVPSIGPPGKNGRDGRDGRMGHNGMNGTNGATGINGTNGRDGENGTINQVIYTEEIPFVCPVRIQTILGSCNQFAVLGTTAVTGTGPMNVIQNGSTGVAPGVDLSGTLVIHGAREMNTGAANKCSADTVTAYNTIAAMACPANQTFAVPEIGGMIILPGVYCTDPGTITISASTVILDGRCDPNAMWYFQAATTMTTQPGASFELINGAQAKNVYWACGTAVNIGAMSTFVGNIIAGTAVIVDHNAEIEGRILASTAITLSGGVVIHIPST